MEFGQMPVVRLAAAWNVPSPFPRRTVTVPASLLLEVAKLTTARSTLPSPLKSPTARDHGRKPVDGLTGVGVKVPFPFPKSTVMVPFISFAMARSGIPSPLKSPMTIESGSFSATGIDDSKYVIPAVPVPSTAVPRTSLPLLASRKDTVPFGEVRPIVFADPTTVAVRV